MFLLKKYWKKDVLVLGRQVTVEFRRVISMLARQCSGRSIYSIHHRTEKEFQVRVANVLFCAVLVTVDQGLINKTSQHCKVPQWRRMSGSHSTGLTFRPGLLGLGSRRRARRKGK